MKWLGKSPFSIGEYDEDTGKILRKRTFFPGEEIPSDWLELARQANPLEIDDKGKYSDKKVERAIMLDKSFRGSEGK